MAIDTRNIVEMFWNYFDKQNWDNAAKLLHDDFTAYWITTNEKFSKTNFLLVNRNYPCKWNTKLKKYDEIKNGGVSIVHVYSEESKYEFYVTTYYEFENELIKRIEEYWSTVEDAPEWREEYNLK